MTAKRQAADDLPTTTIPKKLKSDFTRGEAIAVIAGTTESQVFTVHKDLLCSSSTFFRAATSNRWSESSSANKIVRLPETPPYALQVYLEWLYDPSSDILDAIHALRSIRKDKEIKQCQDETYHLSRAWILGDFLGDCNFTNAVMKRLLQMGIDQGNKLNDATFKMILRECPSELGLYKWLVDTSCGLYDNKFIDFCKDFATAEFFQDMLRAYMTPARVPTNKAFLPIVSQLRKYEQREVEGKLEEAGKETVEKENVKKE